MEAGYKKLSTGPEGDLGDLADINRETATFEGA
ncbi:hypothetical protein LP7551_00332 [Roseibium album]|nr:hypothetical protein LP7551_00332 [Roseibium album]